MPPSNPDAGRSQGASGPVSRLLFLDDDPERAEVFLKDYPHAVWVQTAADCIEKLGETWDEVHLDHDLGGERYVNLDREDCGMEVVRWICLLPRPHLKKTRFYIHSHNASAATMMAMQILSNGFFVEVRPFGSGPLPPLPPEDPLPRPPSPWLLTVGRVLRWLMGRPQPITPRHLREELASIEAHRRARAAADPPPPNPPDGPPPDESRPSSS